MPEVIRGHTVSDIVRKNCGSPAEWFILPNVTESVFIEYLGSSIIYCRFDATTDTGSLSFLIPAYDHLSLTLRTGSVSIQGSGTTSPEVQVIGIR